MIGTILTGWRWLTSKATLIISGLSILALTAGYFVRTLIQTGALKERSKAQAALDATRKQKDEISARNDRLSGDAVRDRLLNDYSRNK